MMLRKAANLSLKNCLRMEIGLAHQFTSNSFIDFRIGVTAKLIDKTNMSPMGSVPHLRMSMHRRLRHCSRNHGSLTLSTLSTFNSIRISTIHCHPRSASSNTCRARFTQRPPIRTRRKDMQALESQTRSANQGPATSSCSNYHHKFGDILSSACGMHKKNMGETIMVHQSLVNTKIYTTRLFRHAAETIYADDWILGTITSLIRTPTLCP